MSKSDTFGVFVVCAGAGICTVLGYWGAAVFLGLGAICTTISICSKPR